MPPGPNNPDYSYSSFPLRDSELDPNTQAASLGTNITPELRAAGSWSAFLNGPYERVQISTIPLTLNNAQQILHPTAGFHPPSNISFTPLRIFPPHSPPLGSNSALFADLFGQVPQVADSDSELFTAALDAVNSNAASTSSFLPPFSQNQLVVDLPIHQPVVLPPPPTFSDFLTVEKFPWNDFSDGGKVSNALALPLLVIHITHIDEKWTRIFLYAWNEVFHATHTSQPPANLTQTANHALLRAYDRWEQERPNDPLEWTAVTIGGIAMTAIRHYKAPTPFKELLELFNHNFKNVIKKAKQANANHLLRCTLGALVVCKVVPFLPPPHVDINPPQWNNATFVPRAYTSDYKDFFQSSVDWDADFGCKIWHESDGQRLIWFGNKAVRDLLATLLSPDEGTAYTLGVRRARRLGGVTTSWGPVTELDNNAVLALLAKVLASLTTSILSDVIQRPRQLPFDTSDGHRNRLLSERTKSMFAFLAALDDLSLPYPTMPMHHRKEAHSQLVRLKEELGF